ncbi:MAG: hypothetical protein Unbinned6437contig1000_35 [Prokaryotic dsDNA virus sp.]|nr:MAG: hypothetical protein Unbinned6437contig1000_35 [Prokaryotic dsDNA virus sp.]|tara:strand:+ start:20965 stop:21366 length:402 start_codon:yes stop_codon:yes gene_type:complete
MKKIYSKLISLAITSTLAASWYFNLHSLQSFASVIFLILIALVVLCGLVVVHYISEFDDRETEKSEAIKRFKPFSNKTTFDFAFNGFISSLDVILLILINSPVIAAIHLISVLFSLKMSSSCAKRYSKALDME